MDELIEKLRTALRIKSTAFDDELAVLIDACKTDLELSGAPKFSEYDPLCIQAVTFYCKANFGFTGDEGEKYQGRYEAVRTMMAHSSAYGTVGEADRE